METKQEIKVTVSGCANVGKSTITFIILNALIENGIEVDLDDSVLKDYGNDGSKFINRMLIDEEKRTVAVGKNSKITIDEVQLSREHWK